MNANILTHKSDLSSIPAMLRDKYGPNSVSLEGDDDNWTSLVLTKRKLLGKSELKFNALRKGSQLEQIKGGLNHVFSSIPTDQDEIRQKLLIRIAHFNSAIAVDPETKLRGFEDILFAVAKELQGLIFWDGNQMLNEKGRLILDFKGNCRVNDLEVFAEYDAEAEEAAATEDARARKQTNLEWLDEMAVPHIDHLPPIQGEEETTLRSVEEISSRCLALTLVALKGEGLEQEVVEKVYQDLELEGKLSPDEQTFFELAEPSQQDRVNFVWRYESLFVLLWALGYADELGYPGSICDVQAVVKAVHGAGGLAGLVEGANLRSKSEILDEADRIYRLHWAVVDARLRGDGAPADLDSSVVYERHYALNWLIGYQGDDWDEVGTDT